MLYNPYITQQQAKALRRNGFRWSTTGYYDAHGVLKSTKSSSDHNHPFRFKDVRYAAPTIQRAFAWYYDRLKGAVGYNPYMHDGNAVISLARLDEVQRRYDKGEDMGDCLAK